MRRVAAIITDQGGRTAHEAIVSREFWIPCIVGNGNATEVLHDGDEVTVACSEGHGSGGAECYSTTISPTRRAPAERNVSARRNGVLRSDEDNLALKDL